MTCDCGVEHKDLEALLERLGISPTVIVSQTIPPIRAWHVPRVYLLKHLPTAADLPALADRYGWKQV